VRIDLDELLAIDPPTDLTACSLEELRAVRDAHQDLEHGLSYARRILQGRLDTIALELDRRSEDAEGALVERLPDALASRTRGEGLPRPMRDLEPPPWADDLVARLDTSRPTGDLAAADTAELLLALDDLGAAEREVSDARREVHRRIDAIQDELVGRYRSGASVDDLLR
jgi:hypothetical protein